jgi:hypothetical protein
MFIFGSLYFSQKERRYLKYLSVTFQALDCCQLGDEVRKKELKLDSPGLI